MVAWRLATERGLDAFAETTRDYLDLALALERIRRRERSLAFGWMLLGVGAMTGWSAYVCTRCAREPRDLEQLRTDRVAGC